MLKPSHTPSALIVAEVAVSASEMSGLLVALFNRSQCNIHSSRFLPARIARDESVP
jgi:hypothetical protein